MDRAVWRCERYWDDDVGKDEALDIENLITERYFVDRGIANQDVRGGRYTTESKCENFCSGNGLAVYDRDRPLCKCGYPCEVKMKTDTSKIYFVCPVPDWVDGFTTPDKCNFWQEYVPYRLQKEENALRKPTAAEAFADCED